MKWLNLQFHKPKDGQRVLCFHPKLNDGHGLGTIRPGYYTKQTDTISPFLSSGFEDVRWWMPLPKPPKAEQLTRKPRPPKKEES